MRLIYLLLAAAAAVPAPAPAQPGAQPAVQPAARTAARGPAAAPAVRSDRAARLDALDKAAGRGEVAVLRRALRTERDRDVRVLIDARLRSLRLDWSAASDPRLRRLAAAGSPRDIRIAALTILGGMAFSSGDYARTAGLARDLEQLQKAAGNTEAAGLTGMTRQIADMLAGEPRQRLEGGLAAGRSGARRDVAGLMRVDVRVNSQDVDAVFDTGANLSVLSASTAQRLGARLLEGKASVGNSVRGTVPVQLAIADRFEIGGNVLRDVVFLVIDDAALSFGPGGAYKIPAIIGYPVMQALGRFRMDEEAFHVEPAGAESPAPAPAPAPNLYVSAGEMFVDAKVGGIAVPLYLDSGANPSHLNPPFAVAYPAPLAGLVAEQRQRAGAGGRATDQAVRWRDVAVELAGRRVQLPSLIVGVPGGDVKPSSYYGVIGADLLGRFTSYTIDLRRMRLELGAPRPAAAPAQR
jgi:predicted aspartyl protease